MDIKLIKINKNMIVLQSLFNTMSRTLTKDEMQQLVFTDSLKALCSAIARYNSPVYRTKVVFAYLINLLAQVDIDHVSSLLDQAVALNIIGLYGLQINSNLGCIFSSSYINYCTIETLRLRFKDFESLRTHVDLNNSEINVLRVALDTPTTFIKNPYEETEQQIRRWLISSNTKVNELQIVFK